ncbi:ankyrin repeat domain-containing protein [Candidatus Dependentiae bacterium]|nr:ankyrin repeat domain-containing protein [Candidatus Dependentiae bacterium]
MKACIKGNIPLVEKLLQAGFDPNYEWYNSTPLMAACSNSQTAIVTLLLMHGANPNLICVHTSALMRAVSAGSAEYVEQLLIYGADANFFILQNSIQNSGVAECETVLLRAIYKGHAAIVELLLFYGANPNYRPNRIQGVPTPLLAALKRGSSSIYDLKTVYQNPSIADTNKRMAKALLVHGADVHAQAQNNTDEELETAALIAAASGDITLLDLLLFYGLTEIEYPYIASPLHIAVRANNRVFIERYHALGGTINAKDHEERTPLHEAARTKNTELIELLMQLGAHIDSKDSNGQTPLYEALEDVDWDITTEHIRALLEHGADTQIQDYNGDTPLIFVIKKYDAESCSPEDSKASVLQAIDILLEFDATPLTKNNSGESAYDLAQKEGLFLWT